LGDLADVQEPISAGEERDEGSELGDLGYLAVVLLAQFGRCRERFDLSLDGLGSLRVLRVDADGAVFADLDRRTERLEFTDLLPTRSDDGADLVGRDLHRQDARRVD